MSVLITGGSGYIGSHICVDLILAGYKVIVFDNFVNSHSNILRQVKKITGFSPKIIQGDIRDRYKIEKTIKKYNCTEILHLAGLKSVNESVETPLLYYDSNVVGSNQLFLAMQNCGVKKIVFSSSATVYGEPKFLPITEDHPLSPINPYGRSKLIVENILRDVFYKNNDWRICILRYFNPVGAHKSGFIGEAPQKKPNNLMPALADFFIEQNGKFHIFGNDYPTKDGTGIRDYVHVTDLSRAHVKALKILEKQPQCVAINLGSGTGYSVLDVIKAFEHVSNHLISYEFSPRRQGDVASCYASSELAKKLLGWQVENDLIEMARDHWNWLKIGRGCIDKLQHLPRRPGSDNRTA